MFIATSIVNQNVATACNVFRGKNVVHSDVFLERKKKRNNWVVSMSSEPLWLKDKEELHVQKHWYTLVHKKQGCPHSLVDLWMLSVKTTQRTLSTKGGNKIQK